jgi:hypothetical protein
VAAIPFNVLVQNNTNPNNNNETNSGTLGVQEKSVVNPFQYSGHIVPVSFGPGATLLTHTPQALAYYKLLKAFDMSFLLLTIPARCASQ